MSPGYDEVPTSVGVARVYVAAAAKPLATLVLGTGASGSVEAVDLSLMPRQLPVRGVSVVRVEQPWHVAGAKMVARPPILDAGWRDVLATLRADPRFAALAVADHPLVVGGRSNGARVACRTAGDPGIDGVVCFAFPLHPPGRPDQTRLPELLAPQRPRLIFQGERDAFGTAAQLRAELDAVARTPPTDDLGPATEPTAIDAEPDRGVRVIPVPYADHSMRAAKSAPITGTQIAELLIHTTVAFCLAPTGAATTEAATGADRPE